MLAWFSSATVGRTVWGCVWTLRFPPDKPHLYLPAFDHRASFSRDLFGIQGALTPADVARVSDAARHPRLLTYLCAARRPIQHWKPAERARAAGGRG